MIAMAVDWPLRKDDIRLLRHEDAAERLEMTVVKNCAAVNLVRKTRASFQNRAGILRFRCANACALFRLRRTTITLSAIQIEHHDLMMQICVAGGSSGAAAFRVTRVPTRDHNLQRSGLAGKARSQQTTDSGSEKRTA